MTGTPSSDAMEQDWWLEWTHSHSLTATACSSPMAKLSGRSEFRGERLDACPRRSLHADHQVVRAGGHLEHRAASRRRVVSEFDVPRAPPMDDMVARSLCRRTHIRIFRLYDLLRQQLSVSHLCAAAPVIFLLLHEILVRQRWRPGKTGALLGVVCALQFFVWSEVLAGTVVMGVIAARSLTGRQTSPVARATALRGHGLRLRSRCRRSAARLSVVVHVRRPAKHQGITEPPSAVTLYPSDLLGAIVPSRQMVRYDTPHGDSRPTVLVRQSPLPGASPPGRSRVVRGITPSTEDDPLRWGTDADRLRPVPGSPSIRRRSRNTAVSSVRSTRASPPSRGLHPGPVFAFYRALRSGDVRDRARRALEAG